MNLFEKMFPGAALRRAQAMATLKAYYEAAEGSIYRKSKTSIVSADTDIRRSGATLRAEARHLEQNLDIAKGIIDTLTANIVGMGVRPEPQVRTTGGEYAADVNQALLALWEDFVKYPDVTGELNFYMAQRLACRTWLRDGECFTQLVKGKVAGMEHVSQVPLSIELIEADLVPLDLNEPENGIFQGIQKNKWGKPTWFHLYKEHPSESIGTYGSSDLKKIKSENMIHLKLVNRIRQTRGVSIFATVIKRLDDVKDIEESERVAARVAAAMTGYIKKGTPDLYIPSGDESYRELDMVPGMIFDDLMPGEDIGTIISNRPNNQLIAFRDSQLRAVSAGTNSSYSTISKNYNGTYAAQRQELTEQYAIYGMLWSQFADLWVRKIWNTFIDMGVLAGLIPNGYDIATLYDVELSRPAMPHIDPFKEATASERLVAAGFESRSQVIRARGKNPDEVLRQIVREKQQEEEFDLSFSTSAGKIVQPQQQVGAEKEKDDEEDAAKDEGDGEDDEELV